MITLDFLLLQGWRSDNTFHDFPCDKCDGVAMFTRMAAPDCNVTALAGIGGSRSDTYGIYCEKCA